MINRVSRPLKQAPYGAIMNVCWESIKLGAGLIASEFRSRKDPLASIIRFGAPRWAHL